MTGKEADAIVQRSNGTVVAKLAFACQSSDF